MADGPGSFTGLRVAAAVAKALARAGGVTLAVTPSLLGRAARVVGADGGLVLSATSALRGEVYAGWYRFGPGETVAIVQDAEACTWDQVCAGPKPDLVAGDGPDGFLESLGRYWGVPVVVREGAHADAAALLTLDGATRRQLRCPDSSRLGTDLWPARRGAGQMGARAWQNLARFARHTQLTPRSSASSSGSVFPTPGRCAAWPRPFVRTRGSPSWRPTGGRPWAISWPGTQADREKS